MTLAASTAHGLCNGIQTIRQLLPVWINRSSVMPGPWTMPAVPITDHPRYTYRGLMLDIARHYESPAATQRLIAQAAAYKINVFHLHLSDDQGFRIVINGFPNLTAIGGQGSVGTGGRTMDPGGYWTQAEYRAVVADARAHFMTPAPLRPSRRLPRRGDRQRARNRHCDRPLHRPVGGLTGLGHLILSTWHPVHPAHSWPARQAGRLPVFVTKQ